MGQGAHSRERCGGSVRPPGPSLLIVIVMALGMGGIAALLAVVDGVWLKAVPYGDANRLFLISVRTPFTLDRSRQLV